MLEMWGGDRGHFRQAVGWRRPLWLGHWSQQPALGRSGPGHVRDAWKETPAPLVWVEKHPMGLGTGGDRQEEAGEEEEEDQRATARPPALLPGAHPRLRCLFRPKDLD